MKELDQILMQTIADRKLQPAEKKALLDWMNAKSPTDADRALARSRAFEAARAVLFNEDALSVIDWLEDVIRVLSRPAEPIQVTGPNSGRPISKAFFSPGDACPKEIIRLISQSRKQIDICVFTITDDRISDSIIQAHRRGVKVRIITDDEKASDLGSDVDRFESEQIPLRIDRTPAHMHHKYAIFDTQTLLTGSYNWTRAAARDNQENMITTTDGDLLREFTRHFEQLWLNLEN